jgi:hypothetical protein
MTTIICPDDLIATVAALTLSIRVIGGSIGYCAYYNVFINKFVPAATHYIGGAMFMMNITDLKLIEETIILTGASLIEEIAFLPGIKGNEIAYETIVKAGQLAFAEAYKWVYYSSIAFGCVSIIAACFLGDISKYMVRTFPYYDILDGEMLTCLGRPCCCCHVRAVLIATGPCLCDFCRAQGFERFFSALCADAREHGYGLWAPVSPLCARNTAISVIASQAHHPA